MNLYILYFNIQNVIIITVLAFSQFQFGWIANPDLVNSIAMMVLPLPSLIVINTTTNHHHIPEDETEKLTPHVIELFLEQIRNESAPVYKIYFLNKFKILYVVRKN